MEEKNKCLVLAGTVKGVKKIMEELIEQYGNITVNEYLDLMGKKRVVLV